MEAYATGQPKKHYSRIKWHPVHTLIINLL
jgi:hypothetical protein